MKLRLEIVCKEDTFVLNFDSDTEDINIFCNKNQVPIKQMKEDDSIDIKVNEAEVNIETQLSKESSKTSNKSEESIVNEKTQSYKELESKETSDKSLNLREISMQCSDYKEFIRKVVKKIGLGKNEELLDAIMNVAVEQSVCNSEKVIIWNDISPILFDKFECLNTRKNMISREIKLKWNIKFMNLIHLVIQYSKAIIASKELAIQKEESKNEEIDEEQGEIAEKEKNSLKRVRMQFMPEIPFFEEVLGGIDKTQKIQDRIYPILEAMGIEKVPQKKEIFDVINNAIRKKDIKAYMEIIPLEERMDTSEFINKFISKYSKNLIIESVFFIKELQKVLINENEIE